MTPTPNFFQPFKKLREATEFKLAESGFFGEAHVFGKFFSRCNRETWDHPEANKAWVREVYMNLLSRSSTCELHTACGCTRIIDIDDEHTLMRGCLIPLMTPMTAFSLSDFIEEAVPMRTREFRWNRRYDRGMKILEEVLT